MVRFESFKASLVRVIMKMEREAGRNLLQKQSVMISKSVIAH